MNHRKAVMLGGPRDGMEFTVPADPDGVVPVRHHTVYYSPPYHPPNTACVERWAAGGDLSPAPEQVVYRLQFTPDGHQATDSIGRLVYGLLGATW